MKIDVVMPKMGESITEGTILEWRKQVGETIGRDEILLEIGTDKVDSEIPSAKAGVLVEILANPNDVVEVGRVIARIETDAAAVSKIEPAELEMEPDPVPEQEAQVAEISRPIAHPIRGKRFYTPVVMKIAAEAGVSMEILEKIPGTGRGGRVTKKDIQKFLRESPVVSDSQPALVHAGSVSLAHAGTREPMNHMRRLIADHMRKSLDTSAHVYVVNEVDMTAIVNFVRDAGADFKKREGFSLTYTPFIMAALIESLKEFPELNASLDGTDIVYHKHLNLGMAVAVENGLMVPVIPHCEELNFLGLCRKVTDLAVRTRSRQINPDELQGSTFSITNFGVFNVTIGLPIINQPNVGILGVGTIKKRPVVIESDQGDTIGIRSIMMLTLGMDHRLIDGAGGSRFLDSVRHHLETMKLEGLI